MQAQMVFCCAEQWMGGRFYQVEPSRSGQAGTGLGLTMVRQIAALHGGTVTLDSAPGVGSCFTFRFPVGEQPDGGENRA